MLHKMPIYENNRELGRSPFGGRVVELHQLMGKAAQCWSATGRYPSSRPNPPTPSCPFFFQLLTLLTHLTLRYPARQQLTTQVIQVQKFCLDPFFTNTLNSAFQQISWISGPSSKKR